MTVRPTVMPAIMSETSHSMEYLGSHVRIGIRLFTFSKAKMDYALPANIYLILLTSFPILPATRTGGSGSGGRE